MLAVERFVSRVFSLVPGQLVRPGEPPATVLPLTHVGFLPGVGPEVSLEVAGLGVRLAAARVVAGVGGTLPLQDDHHLRAGGCVCRLTTRSTDWRLTRGRLGQTRR